MNESKDKWQTIDNGTCVDVVPYKDDREHGLGDECWCNPNIEKAGGVPLVTHNKHEHSWGEWKDGEPMRVQGKLKIISVKECGGCDKIQSRIGTVRE